MFIDILFVAPKSNLRLDMASYKCILLLYYYLHALINNHVYLTTCHSNTQTQYQVDINRVCLITKILKQYI